MATPSIDSTTESIGRITGSSHTASFKVFLGGDGGTVHLNRSLDDDTSIFLGHMPGAQQSRSSLSVDVRNSEGSWTPSVRNPPPGSTSADQGRVLNELIDAFDLAASDLATSDQQLAEATDFTQREGSTHFTEQEGYNMITRVLKATKPIVEQAVAAEAA